MKVALQYYRNGGWILLARFEDSTEAIRLLPAIGRIMNCSVRLKGPEFQGLPELGSEPIPRGVTGEVTMESWLFRVETK